MYSIEKMKKAARRRLKRLAQRSRDAGVVRRALTILRLGEDGSVALVAEQVSAARSSVYRWQAAYREAGIKGLRSARRGREVFTCSSEVIMLVCRLIKQLPRELGYLRSGWSSELLALEIARQSGVTIHASTVRRLLPRLAYGWRRARPTLCLRDPRKSERLAAIEQALTERKPGVAVFYVDEADIDLNPRIGFSWSPQGQQLAIPTPGTNQKRYLAGALHAESGRVVCVEAESKNSALFIALLKALWQRYRGRREILLILDNYCAHKSQATDAWLAAHRKFRLLFQPAYHPWVNRIERLWKTLHDTVTRNHRYPTISQLMTGVRRFLHVVQPFPGNQHALARAN